MDADELRSELDRRAGEVAPQVIAWRHHLHAHPELPNRERRTAGYVTDHLRSLGLDEVRTGIAGHGVVGVLRGGRAGARVAALRADIDALPLADESGVDFSSAGVTDADYPGGPFPVAHACGHDCHTAILMGAASVLCGAREGLPGTVLFVFQPAEEGPPVDEAGGARAMLAEGAFTDPEPTMVFGLHVSPMPKGMIGYRIGNQYAASTLVKITITGRPAHGSAPWLGADPMPAVGGILTGIGQLYRQLPAHDPVTVSIGHIEDGGRFNIIGATVTLWGTIRCSLEQDMPVIQQRLRVLAGHTARAYGCVAEVAYLQQVPAVRNTETWVTAALPTLRRVAGDSMVAATQPLLAYDDISVLVNRFGGLYVTLGVQDSIFDQATGMLAPIRGGRGLVANHDPRFYADDATLATGVRLHAHIASDHLAGLVAPR